MSEQPAILTEEQITALRVEWLDDFIDLRPQWGTPVVASPGAAKGAQELGLSGLAAAGTLRAGTRFQLSHNGQAAYYSLRADAEITSGAASAEIGPPLISAVLAGARVQPEPRLKSLYNKRTGRLFFSDEDLQSLADRVIRLRGVAVNSADDRTSMLFRGVRYYGWTAMLASDEYLTAILSNETGTTGSSKALLDQKQKTLQTDGVIFLGDEVGAGTVRFVR